MCFHRCSDTFPLSHQHAAPPSPSCPPGALRSTPFPSSRPHAQTGVDSWSDPSRGLPHRLTCDAQTRQAASPGCGHVTCCSRPLRRKCGRAPRASEKPQRAISSGLRRSARYCRISSSERTRQRAAASFPHDALLMPPQTRVSSGERKGEARRRPKQLHLPRAPIKMDSECLLQGLEVFTDHANPRPHSQENERWRVRDAGWRPRPQHRAGDVLPPAPGRATRRAQSTLRADTLPETGRPPSGETGAGTEGAGQTHGAVRAGRAGATGLS